MNKTIFWRRRKRMNDFGERKYFFAEENKTEKEREEIFGEGEYIFFGGEHKQRR